MSLIEAIQLRKKYRCGEAEICALKGVDVSIDKGEFTAVWGPSGSGKTTLLNLIGTIDYPTGGKLFFQGEDVATLRDNKRTEMRNHSIGFIFQGFNLIPVLSALENVMLPLQINGTSTNEAKKRALHCLSEVGVSNFVDHRPDRMSGGQQQRVAIARALVTEPAVILADEPTANLDTETAKNIISIMQKLNQKEETTFVFSTHDQRLINNVRRLIRLEDGNIINGGKNCE